MLTPEISTGYWNARKTPSLRPLLGAHLEQVLALYSTSPGGDRVAGSARQHVSEGRLARTVRAHDRVHLAGAHREVEAAQDLLVGDARVKVSDLEHTVFNLFNQYFFVKF